MTIPFSPLPKPKARASFAASAHHSIALSVSLRFAPFFKNGRIGFSSVHVLPAEAMGPP